jgi:predicted HD phosphohydrolase
MDVVTFTRMDRGTAEEFRFLDSKLTAYAAETRARLPSVMLKFLKEQQGNALGYRIDRYQHSLQTATRALRDGADEETITICLLHDIGDGIGLFNHAEFAAAVLKPFVSERNAWIVKHHGIFQAYYYAHYLGQDRDMRERYRGHPHFQDCVDFCERWDQMSFDPGYDTLPIEAFEPLIHRLFAKPPSFF